MLRNSATSDSTFRGSHQKDQCASESDPQPHVEDKYGNIQTQPLSSDEPAQNKPTFSQSYVKKRPYQVGNKLNKPTVEDWYYLENIKNWYGITFSGFDMYEIGQIMRAIYAIAAKMGGSGAFKDIYFGGIQFIKVNAVQFYDGCATPPCNATTSRDGGRTITLGTGAMNANTIVHEMGHALDFRHNLSNSLSWSWANLGGPERLYSAHRSNVGEYFADAFMVWVNGRVSNSDSHPNLSDSQRRFFDNKFNQGGR